MPKRAELTREELETIIRNYEAAGKDTTELKKALAEAYPPNPVAKIPVRRRIAYEEAAPKFVSPEILEIESHYSLIELRDMARKEGLIDKGTKDVLCLRLIRAGIIRR